MSDESVPRAPHPALRGLVTDYHGYRHTGGTPGLHRGLPSTELTVVLALEEPLDVAWLHDDASRARHWAMVSGLHAAPAAIRHTGFQHGIQLGFTPAGARALLGLPAGAFARQLLAMHELLGASAVELHDEVAAAPTWAARFAVLDRHLLTRAAKADLDPVRRELRWAWRALHVTGGRCRVEALAAELGWSRRHLTELFTREFGIGPKQLASVVRFRCARDLVAGGVPLATAALDAGYADQAHLSRDWSRLAGCTPTTWLHEELPFVQDAGPEPLPA